MKNLTTILTIFALIGMVAANNGGDPTIFHTHSVIPVTGVWSTGTSATNCATGAVEDSWQLTLSEAKDVTIQVDDCCCVGDYYEIYVDGVLKATTPVPIAWGCGQPGTPSSGSVTVSLMPGTYTITVRDAGFDGHDLDESDPLNMCPAGLTVSGSVAPYTGTTVPEAGFAVAAIALLTPGMIYLVRRKR